MSRSILALSLAAESAVAWTTPSGGTATRCMPLGIPGPSHLPSHILALDSRLPAILSESACDTLSIDVDVPSSGPVAGRGYRAKARMIAVSLGIDVLEMPSGRARRDSILYYGTDRSEIRLRARDHVAMVDRMTDPEIDAALLLLASVRWYEVEAMIADAKSRAQARARELMASRRTSSASAPTSSTRARTWNFGTGCSPTFVHPDFDAPSFMRAYA